MLVCLLIVVMTRQRAVALTAELGLFLQQYGPVEVAGLIILIAGAAAVYGHPEEEKPAIRGRNTLPLAAAGGSPQHKPDWI